MFKKTLVAAAFAACLPVSTALAKSPWLSPPAAMFIECSAVYDAASALMQRVRPAQSKVWRQMANGAEVAGALMTFVASKEDSEYDAISLSDALAATAGLREVMGTSLLASIEADPNYDIGDRLDFCLSMAQEQEAIVNEARAMMYGNK